MSAPLLIAGGAMCLALALPVVAASEALVAQQRLDGATDAAALAAADALTGWVDTEPCAIAEQVIAGASGRLVECAVDHLAGSVRVRASTATMLGTAHSRARAGQAFT